MMFPLFQTHKLNSANGISVLFMVQIFQIHTIFILSLAIGAADAAAAAFTTAVVVIQSFQNSVVC